MTRAKSRIFREKALQARFDRDGYVVIDFISTEQIKLIESKFYELHDRLPDGFYSDTFNSSDEFKRGIYTHVESIFEKSVEQNFCSFKKLGSTFLCKSPGIGSEVPVHQDWTVVNESDHYSATIWVPTIDTNNENGAMRVLPGSHLFFDTYRAPNLDFCYKGNETLINDAMIEVPMRAGQALVLNHAVIHASGPNMTQNERIAIAYGLIPTEADLVYYHVSGNGKIEKYSMPDDFFQRYYNIGERPLIGTLVDEFDYAVNKVSARNISELINRETRKRNMLPLFKDNSLQRDFDNDGYVKVPVLDSEEVSRLMQFYESVKFKDEAGFGFHISMDQQDKEMVKLILNKLFEVAVPKLKPYFKNAKPFVGSFVIKECNPTSIVPVHQDWSFVEDEDKYCSVTCWIPLVDVDIDNGALGVIKGSHNYFKNLRPSPSPQVPSPISEHMFTVFPYLHLIDMKAGEALIFDNRTFHGSPPNVTDKPRIAFGIGFTQEEAQLAHYYLKPDGKKETILKYRINEDFFLRYENSRLSKLYDQKGLVDGFELIEETPYTLPKLSADELTELIKSTGNVFNVEMCEKLAKLFSYNMNGTPDTAPKTDQPIAVEKAEAVREAEPWKWVDERSFFEKYTVKNIVTEVRKKLFYKEAI